MPGTLLLFISFNVMVTVEAATPLATNGPVPSMVELAATAAPAVKTTDPSAFATGVRMESVFVSAAREVNVQVAIPAASETEHDP
jgi:hypothetical protein